MTDAALSLLMLVALIALVAESICRRHFPCGIRRGIRNALMIRRMEKTIERARRVVKEATDD